MRSNDKPETTTETIGYLMKIGIITFHFVHNYGGVLQAYALQRYLQSLGHDVELINYHPDWVENGGRFKWPVSKRTIRADIVIAYQKFNNLKRQLTGNRELVRSYAEFQRNHLTLSPQRFRNLRQLRATPPRYDVYVCGSDQIWNPSVQYGVDPAYFLDFGHAKRIAYAASFGRPEIESAHHAKIGALLAKFSAISVRESNGVDLIERLSGCVAACLPDPTLMWNDYDAVAEAPDRNREYLMSYVLRSGENVGEIQTVLASLLDLEIVVPYNHHRRWKGVSSEVVCSPGQWLGYIRHSRFVVTNSFHGTLFSVIFKKPFIFVGLGGKKSGLNERSISFLTRLGLTDRMMLDSNPGDARRIAEQEIDWRYVYGLLEEWRAEADSFVRNALASE